MARPDWLPELVLFSSAKGNWNRYVEIIYAHYKTDFIDSKPTFQGTELSIKRYPPSNGKEHTFWHIVQEGKIEEERTPGLRRCERIRWPRPIIENSSDTKIKIWKNRRRNKIRVLIRFQNEKDDYLVVIEERNKYLLFITAYPVDRTHTRGKLDKEYVKYQAEPF